MEIDKLTAEVVRFMLFKSHKQPNVPVKREELAQLITENYKQRSLPGTVIANAQVNSMFCEERAVHGSSRLSVEKHAQCICSQAVI